ncbi:hypothetical protein [Streptomyces sp. NRRL WC-3549]|uniref:hypothetical protein n=1 Tax=Streptomyces sp. NRRL WC-3549 TaxID=1463925 RepID=UPI0004C9BF1D|nr:hypothetical protein [Streptomyces sp. NRRL WC-3549]
MSTPQTTRFVRLRVDLMLEITDTDALTGAALEALTAEHLAPEDAAGNDTHAEEAVREDAAEAVAALIDPFDLVGEVPGVELVQASWDSEPVEHDPDTGEWAVEDDEDDAYDGTEENETDDEEAVDVTGR